MCTGGLGSRLVGIAVILAGLATAGWGKAQEPVPPRRKPAVSIDAMLERQQWKVANLQWRDTETLIGDFVAPGASVSTTRTLSLTGTIGAPIAQGDLSSISPDGSLLLQRTGDRWVFRDLQRGAARDVALADDEPCRFAAYRRPAWARDGRFAAIAEYCSPSHRERQAARTLRDGVAVIDLSGQVPSIALTASRVTILDRDAREIRQVVVKGLVVGMSWGPSDALYITRTDFAGNDASTEVLRVGPTGKPVRTIYESRGRYYEMTPAVHPEGGRLALVLDLDNRTWSDFMSVLLIDARAGRELRRLTSTLPMMGSDYAWSPQGEEIYARVRHGGLDQIYAIPLDGQPRRLTRSLRRHFNLVASPDGRRLAYQTEDGYGRQDIRLLELDTMQERVVFVLDDPRGEFTLGEWQHIRWSSSDGVEPFGFLFLPPDFDPAGKYPMFVHVHGGGEGSSLYLHAPLTRGVKRGPLEWHAWAALGYVVFVPDYRSTGNYGPDVIADRYRSGQIGALKDVEDIVAGTRHVISLGYVDPSRVVILGHSAGGQRVHILLTRHDLYAAAVLNEPIEPDPTSLFIHQASGPNTGGYPAGAYRQMYGGALADSPGRYKTNFMFDSYRIRTPVLIMLGNEALGGVYQVPSEVLYSILRQHDVPARLLKFVDEGHTYSRSESARLAFKEARLWLERHLLPENQP